MTYNFNGLNCSKKTNVHLARYLYLLKQKAPHTKKSILEMYIDLFYSENYKILFFLIPGFNLIQKIKFFNDNKSPSVRIIGYL